jgi:hypothetical protein
VSAFPVNPGRVRPLPGHSERSDLAGWAGYGYPCKTRRGLNRRTSCVDEWVTRTRSGLGPTSVLPRVTTLTNVCGHVT